MSKYNGKDLHADAWHTGTTPKVACECSYRSKDSMRFYVTNTVLGVIYKLCDEIKTEWQALLIGKEDLENNRVTIHDYFIPKQEVTQSTVTNLHCVDKKLIDRLEIVATIHSHSDMGVFFSQTDETETNLSLIKHHIVVNNKGEFTAKSRRDLPCGMVSFSEAEVVRDIERPDRIKGFKKIKVKTYGAPALYDSNNRYKYAGDPPLNGWPDTYEGFNRQVT